MKKKSLKRLSLNKETVSKLNESDMDNAKGGTSVFLCITVLTVFVCTHGDGCDMPTIGWDDGPNCLSQEANWCYGRG